MTAMLDGNSTLEMLAAHANDVKYASGIEERALIAYERFCFEVAMQGMGKGEAAIQNYGSARRILIQALKAAPLGTGEHA
jgi:hypothetical protein